MAYKIRCRAIDAVNIAPAESLENGRIVFLTRHFYLPDQLGVTAIAMQVDQQGMLHIGIDLREDGHKRIRMIHEVVYQAHTLVPAHQDGRHHTRKQHHVSGSQDRHLAVHVFIVDSFYIAVDFSYHVYRSLVLLIHYPLFLLCFLGCKDTQFNSIT